MNDKKKPIIVCDSLYIKTINEDHIHNLIIGNIFFLVNKRKVK